MREICLLVEAMKLGINPGHFMPQNGQDGLMHRLENPTIRNTQRSRFLSLKKITSEFL